MPGEKIRHHEDVGQALVRSALTDRPVAEEELHRGHVANFGRRPERTTCTRAAHPGTCGRG